MMTDQAPDGREDILIVDDTPANLRLLSQMLASQGYGVRAVTSGPRALESAHLTLPSLILLDIRMPDMDGYEVCERLKANDRTKDVPIIFISALNDIDDKVRAFRVGGVDYITKPFQLEEVLARTETHLALRKLQKRLQETNRKLERELHLAGKVQASFLPHELPEIPGWQLAVEMRPARETSGDFFDVCPLPGGQLGVLIADVVDKGVGAALFMALCSSLIRTYVAEYPAQPERVFNAVNRRLLADTGGHQFVTVFYGVLNPANGKLTYCNAGHSPPLLLSSQSDGEPRWLVRTGIPLGIFDDQEWETQTVSMAPGDMLLLYTDGVTDAQDKEGRFFGEEQLVQAVRSNLDGTAEAVRNTILDKITGFMQGVHQFDDIALVAICRAPDRPA